MKLISISAIKIASNRQRRIFAADSLHELAESIRERGLFHPIILRIVGEDYVLVSGERRLRAITDIHALDGAIRHDGALIEKDTIPYTLFDDLDPLAAEEAELDENIKRQDLDWKERAAAHARLKALRDAQALANGSPLPTIADIALEVRGSSDGVNSENTRREIIVAGHLDNPLVAGAKNVDDAFKILRREESSAKHRELGAIVGRTFTADLHRAVHASATEWLPQQAAETWDVILTDPPYGMGADEFGDSGGLAQGAHGYSDSAENFQSLMEVFVRESFRITKPQAHLYCFCDIDHFHWLRSEFEAAGWWAFRTPLIWYKKAGMRAPWPEHGPQRKYETILYAVKGKRPVLKMAPDVLDYSSDTNLGHAAQKPVALFKDLLLRSVLPGQAVLDPFMGSGTIFEAAHDLKCRATGVELDQASYGIAVGRLERLKTQGELDLAVGI